MVSQWVITYLELGYIRLIHSNPLILSFDPNFQRDIQVDYTSKILLMVRKSYGRQHGESQNLPFEAGSQLSC